MIGLGSEGINDVLLVAFRHRTRVLAASRILFAASRNDDHGTVDHSIVLTSRDSHGAPMEKAQGDVNESDAVRVGQSSDHF